MHYSNQRLSHFTSVCFAGPRPCVHNSYYRNPQTSFYPLPSLNCAPPEPNLCSSENFCGFETAQNKAISPPPLAPPKTYPGLWKNNYSPSSSVQPTCHHEPLIKSRKEKGILEPPISLVFAKRRRKKNLRVSCVRWKHKSGPNCCE